MSFTRRTFLLGAASGASVLVVTACTVDAGPAPTATPTNTPSGSVPAPAGMARSAWSSDSFARGSVSYMAVGSTVEHRDALGQPLLDRVFFAGEATSADHPGTVIGAQLSGNRAATTLADAGSSAERVAVIGAGAAGGEAARVLSLRGYDVVVIEARNRVGGRIHSRTDDSWPLPVELGAWRLSPASDGDILSELARLDISSVALEGATGESIFRSPSAEIEADPVGAPAVATALGWARAQPRDQSLESSLDASGAAAAAAGSDTGEVSGAELLEQYLHRLSTLYGAEASDLSSWFTTDDGAPPILVTGGFTAVITDALDGVETFLSTTVLGVSYNDRSVSLRLGTGESLTVDRVIVTVPLGVLQDEGMEFDPILPFAHRTAIAALGMGTIDTVWLRFEEPFWTTDATAWSLVGTDDDITTWFNLEPLTGEAVLVGIVGGEAARRMEALDDDELVASLRQTLAPFAS
ncbi:MAG: oxidoreductase [Microbacteriaceae bacterium]|jgi:monoamine oxidase|nr:oxidoreductase [Microbacteriaceae bacterium]